MENTTPSVYQPMSDLPKKRRELYCVRCRKQVEKPLQCGDCLALICRECGTPLEELDELGMG